MLLLCRRDLGTNKLRTLHKTTFKGMRSLSELDMFDNHVEYLPAGIFDSLVNLRILYLDSNMFPSLPSRTLDYMPKLAIIKLSGNPWHCDCHTLYISALYEENEMAQGLYFAVTFNCADGTNTLPLNFQININDNNNNNPLWKTEGSAASLATTYDFTIATPVAPGFPITDCVRQIIVRDVDLTNYAINFGIEDNPYFEIGYDEASSTVDKEYKATLRTTTFLRSIPGPLVLRISATEPMFSQPLYTATYNENNQVTLEQTISLQQGYDSQVQFSLEGDYAEDHFDIVVNGNEVSLVVTNPMPSASLRQGQIHLIVNAIREYTSGASSAIINLEFERPHYEGEIVDNALQLTQLILRQGYQDSTLTITVEDYPSFFTAATAGNIITLSMTPLNASIIEANNFINLRVTASTDYSAATTIVTLEIIKDDIETPLFGRSLYSGMYDNTTGLTLEPLLLTQGYDDTVQVTFSGEHEDYFELVRNGASSTLRVVGGGLPSNIWSEQRLLLTIVATKPRTVGASTVVSIALPELENLEFEQAHYEGEIVDNTLQLTQLILSHGYQDSTLTVTVEDYSPFFTATTAGNIITLSMTPLNASIIEANNFINLRVTASTDYSAATTIVTLEIIKDDIETPLFGRSLYSGTYDNTTGLTEQRLLFTIVATKPRTVGASTVVSIALPEARELGFEAPSYRGSLQDNILTLEIITLSVGYGDDVTFTLSGDYSSFFSVSSVQNQVTINPPTQLPQEVISENNFLMFTVTADGLNALPTSTAVLLEIIKDDVTTPVFSQAIYYGNYLGSLDIDIGNMNLAQGYDSSVSFRIEGENSQYFQIIQNANSVTLTVLTAIPEDLIFSEKSFVFNIFADKPLTVGANAAIFVRFSQDLTEPALLQFGRHTYIGSVEKNIMSLENIVLESGFAPGTSFHLTGDYSSLFTPTIENNVIYLSLSSELSAEVLENNKFLILELEARRDRAVPVSASIIIDLVEEETPIIPVFNQAFYTGIYTAENILRFEETISLLQGYDETVTFSLEGESSEWFTLVSNGNSVTLVTSSNVPQDVVDTYHQLLFTVIASKPNTINGESAISIDLPKVILEQEVLRFDQSHYEGRVSESDLQVPTILLVNEITDNIELTMSGNHSEYFSISRQLNIIHIELVRNIPAEVISNNEFLIFEISASKADAVRGYTTLILRIDQEPQIISPVFEQAYYSGEYSEQSGLIFEHTLRLIQGYDETVQFALQGDSSEWFILTQTEPNSLTLSTRDGSLQQLENINHLVFSVLANKPGSIPGEAAIIINLSGTIDNNVATIEQMVLNEGYTTAVMFTLHGDLTDAAVLGFERASYLGIIENNAATIEPIVLNEGYTTAVIFTLHGDLSNYFNIVQQGSSVSIVLQAAIPEQSIPANRIVLLELRATSPGAIPAVTAVVFEVVREDDVALEELVFSAPYYTGQFSEAGGLVFETAISLDEGYDQNVQFGLDGEHAQWFTLVVQGNSVTLTTSGAIPPAVIANNQQLVFVITAEKPNSNTARATIIISLVDDLSDAAVLGFERASYLGIIENNAATIEPIVLNEGYTTAVIFTLHGDLSNYFNIVQQGSSVSIVLQAAIPEQSIPANRIVLLELRATSPGAIPAVTAVVFEVVRDDDVALEELVFSAPYYTGQFSEAGGLVFETAISLDEGYDQNVQFALDGEHAQWFTLVVQGNSVTLTTSGAIPPAVIANNQQLVFVITADKPNSNTARATIVISLVDDLTDAAVLGFERASYLGIIENNAATIEPIVLNEGYTTAVIFTLHGEHAQWFTLVVQGNLVTLTTSGAIPPAVIANNQQLVFVITAEKPNSNTARATIVISLINGLETETESFGQVLYEGTINVNVVQHESITVTGYTGSTVEILGDYRHLFAASLTEGAVVVAAVGNLALPDDVSHVPLELRAGAAIHLQERVSITGEGEIHLSAPTNTGVYSFEVTATSVITQVQATASVQLTVEVTATCGDDDHALPPLIILDRDEEEPHDNLVVLDSATQSGCTYRLTNRWPPEHDWLYVDENGLHARRIDREDPRIAFMALSQIQVELVLECPSDTQTRVKRSLSTSSRHDLLGPYDYGSNKWILTDTILYNSRRSFVNLIVNDINDNYPVFIGYENEPIVVGYPIPELEEVVLPRALVELKATDADVGENAQLQFWSPEPVLAVASSTGSVHVRDGATLTDEEVLTVSVTDLNGREDGLTTSMELMVKLIDTRHIAVVTVRNAFLDHEDNILSNLTAAVGYEVKVLSSAVISDDTDTSSANARNKREVTSEGASLQLYVYGLIDREPVAVERLSTDISENVAAIDVTSTISLEDHLEGREIPVSAGRDTGLLVATIVLSILLFILIVAIAVRKARNYEQFSDANSLASRNEPLEDLPKVESLKKPRLNLEELKRSERRLQEMLEAPIEDTTVKPSTSDELDPSGAFDTIINMAPPDIPMPIVIQSIDRLKDNATSEDEDEFGERANKSRRKSVVTFNENVEKIIHVEDIPDDNSSDLEIFKF
ncbi:hypothetical protein MSG28_007544 [Choristoneura fumiferana]|uniref:Uncharacterized protein n=1 Tax=Choristoneura fumiferana TaxID=7141 RepID=A0ACC0JXS3_CHOFU|nr:hypothetical protein MSG28_007544 [Choristoneura fumiferana]